MKFKYELDMIDMGDEVIAVPVGDGSNDIQGVFTLNKAGEEIMSLLKTFNSEEAVVRELGKKYNGSANDFEVYVHGFVVKLQELGVVDL